MLGGLHIEQSLLIVQGQLIENSGLKEILLCDSIWSWSCCQRQSNERSQGKPCADVTQWALYQKFVEVVKKEGSLVDPYERLSKKAKCSTMCYYWKVVLDLETEILIFICSGREGNITLYFQSLRALTKWVFFLRSL